ncbi:MAG TPA: threonine synthase [Caulobacteraceae bacterium]|nr:threonine synthase [Caulobacteraceae bacterium]
MRYISTRGDAPPVGFLEAVLAGLAPDGGLYSPEVWPLFSADEIARFHGRPYAEVAADVLAKFAGEALPRTDLLDITSDAYAGFTHAAVAPLKELSPGYWLLELFHGPTLAFKDIAMQLLARLYERALERGAKPLTIVCATSGDTGGGAVEAFAGRAGVRLVVLFPDGKISEVQRRFMTTAEARNVQCLAVDGSFDDCQAIVKGLFHAQGFREAVNLTGVNSINWARIAAQVVYYFTAAVALGAPARPVAFATPTGNFGDAFAGWVARRMGLPIERIIVATNSNDILARTFEDGIYARGPVVETQSPAMDIQIASNFERLYFETVEREGVETARAMRAFADQGSIQIPPKAFATMREVFVGASISEAETRRAIVSTFHESGELIDPHTAVGVAAARAVGPSRRTTPVVVLSTAHPAKFPEAVQAAAGVAPPTPPAVRTLVGKTERVQHIPADLAEAQAFVRDFAEAG